MLSKPLPQLSGEGESLCTVGGMPADAQIRLQLDELCQGLAHDLVIVNDEQTLLHAGQNKADG